MSVPTAVDLTAGTGPSLRDLQGTSTADLEALLGLRLLPPVLRYNPDRDPDPLPSHTASWLDICQTTTAHREHAPDPVTGWPDRWSMTYRDGKGEMSASVREVDPVDLLDADPMRNSTWHAHS